MKNPDISELENKKIMITGGLGFIGSNLAHRLVESEINAEILIVDSMIPGLGGNMFNVKDIENKVKIHYSDIRDKNTLKYLVSKQDIIFNLAGQASHIDSIHEPDNDLDINCRAQLSLLEACKNENRDVKIIYASTRQI